MKNTEEIRKQLESRKDRSAWSKGVTIYAMEILENLEEMELESMTRSDVKVALLNGADDWLQYSWGGSSLIYDGDIAERLCNPSELKVTRNGERKPNKCEEWLDVQARALGHACERIIRMF